MRGTLREVLPSVDTTRAGVVGVGVVFIRASRASAPILQPVIRSSDYVDDGDENLDQAGIY